MPDSQHLKNLLKQKELIEGHLAWINEEIAKESFREQPVAQPKSLQSRISQIDKDDPPSTAPVLQQTDVIPDLFDELGPDMKSATYDTKKGCFLYFGIGVAILVGIVAYIYLAY